jgi:4-hydroxybenzoate polyprenyltransferase
VNYQYFFIFILVMNVLLLYKRKGKRLTPFVTFLLSLPIVGVIISNAFASKGSNQLSLWILLVSNIWFISMGLLIMKQKEYCYKDLKIHERRKLNLLFIILFGLIILLARFIITQSTHLL